MRQKVKSNGHGVKTSVEFLSKVKTPTPVHSFVNIRDNSKGTGTYYAVFLGSPGKARILFICILLPPLIVISNNIGGKLSLVDPSATA
jgi:hypothetical protein